MIQPFRKYTTTMDRINQNTGATISAQLTINLYDVRDWEECTDEFDLKVPRTIITLHNGQSTCIRVPFSVFENTMDMFLREKGLLDLGTIKKKVDKDGPVKFHFNQHGPFLIGASFPENYKLSRHDPAGANDHMIDNNITTFN